MKKREMKNKIAEKIVYVARETAYRTAGKSFPSGVHEIEPPAEILYRRKRIQ